MQIKFRAIKISSAAQRIRQIAFSEFAFAVALAVSLSVGAAAQNQTNAQPPSSTPQQTTPAGTSNQTQQQQPGAPPASQTQLPPNSATAPINPANEAQQSAQPQTGLQQERQQTNPNATTGAPQPVSPQTPGQQVNAPGGVPSTSNPVGATPTQGGVNATTGTPSGGVNGAQAIPGQNVGASPGAAPAVLPPNPPPVAPNYRAPQRPLPSAERVGVDVSDQVPITLTEAIRLALENNNNIDASRNDVKVAEFNLTAARGVYDPLVSSESYYERKTTPTSSTIGGGANGSVTQTDPTADLRFGGFTPFGGGSYQFDFTSTRLTTNNQFVTLNPQYPTAFTFTYTQPLLRGFRFDQNRYNIEVAKKNLSLSDAQFRQQVIDTITQVEQAYWDLVFALRSLQVQIDAVKQARIQVESNQRLVQQGVLAPIDIVAATTQVTTFEQNVYTAQEAVTRAENTLKTLILPDRTAPLWSKALTPITPVSLEPPRAPLDQAVNAALANRPDLAQLKTNAEINDLAVRYYKDLTKPQVDLVGTYSAAGLAGDSVIASAPSSSQLLTQRVNELSALAGLPSLPQSSASSVSPQLVGGYVQSVENILAQRYPTVRVGVRVSLPLHNRTAEANLGRALTQGARIENQLAQMRQMIEADVRNNLQAIRSAEARLAAAAAARSSAEQQYASQQRQFRAGATTVFLVLQAQTTLITAQGNELQAQTDLNKAISNFQRAVGATLDANHVSVRTDTARRELEMKTDASDAGLTGSVFAPNESLTNAASGASSLTNKP